MTERDKTVTQTVPELTEGSERTDPVFLPSSRKHEANEEVLRLMRAL
jgi:hypothetical protein